MGSGDLTAVRMLLQDKLSFRGPIDTFDAPEPCIESLKKLHHITQRVDIRKCFVDGEDVCLVYDMVTTIPSGTTFIAEWYRPQEQRIASIRVAFDARIFDRDVRDKNEVQSSAIGL